GVGGLGVGGLGPAGHLSGGHGPSVGASGAAALEATTGNLALRAVGGDAWVAVTGATAPVRVDGRPVGWGAPVRVRAGELLEVGAATAGVRCYLAVDGGFDVPAVLGSRSADLLAGLGPAPLTAGMRLPLGAPGTLGPLGPGSADQVPLAGPPAELLLRLTPGPRRDWFEPESLAALGRARYRVSPASNRVGLRLADGPPLRRRDGLGELPSEGMVLGAVQVPPDGMPVVFLADHPTTGGYPVVGVVPEPDLAAAAQAGPGTPVRLLPTARLDA
ncbi:biotin-dependent carboxyltransferase family protein, partial [Streptacidiphilus anmyonensis]|uniref:5-oxoprolinase subunit C family protein n=1 Tax=Streptacidiphilus anmyonensis TaxID=405782 RepID=UPI00128BDC47